MVHQVNDSNFLEYITKYDRAIWFLFRKGQEGTSLSFKPFIEEIPSINMEVAKQFSSVNYFQTYIEDSPKIMEYFNLMDSRVWDYKGKFFNPRIISLKDGYKYYDQSGDKCYCLDTLIEMIFDLYPELVPEPTSEG